MADNVSLKQHNAFEQLPKGDEWLTIKSDGRNLYGAFQLTAETSNRLNISRPHKALVITMSSGPDHQSQNLLGDRIVFPDDLLTRGKLLMGHFAVQLHSLFEIKEEKEYFIVVSLNSMFSNIETLKL